jgi:hypothetical protein
MNIEARFAAWTVINEMLYLYHNGNSMILAFYFGYYNYLGHTSIISGTGPTFFAEVVVAL